MNRIDADNAAQLRWGVYTLLIALAVGNMSGRVLTVNSENRAELEKYLVNRELQQAEAELREQNLPPEDFDARLEEATAEITARRTLQRPFLSANDRSRWLAIRALVEHGTYAIDDVLDNTRWNSIDMVQHRGRDGELHLYSSKPPLLITLLAGEYWLIHKLTGMTLGTHPYAVGRLMLVTVNILPMILMFYLVARMAERLGSTNWGRIFMVGAATLGTQLNTFAVVLNNHIIAAVSATLAVFALVCIWFDGESRPHYYALAGLAAAFTAANELPALSFLALVAVALWFGNRRAWMTGFLPAVAVVIVAFFATNYAANGTFTPPYAHKVSDDPGENWYIYTYTIDGVERQSYWHDRQGIDRGEPSKLTYAWHVLVGHHGIFSLTPIWLLSMAGLAIWLGRGTREERLLAAGILLLTVVCLVFYIGLRPQEDRNYGGMTSGFRWMFWFAPLWLVAMLPAVDRMADSRAWKSLALVLLVFSALSASYPTWNPWTQPWIYEWMEYLGWRAPWGG